MILHTLYNSFRNKEFRIIEERMLPSERGSEIIKKKSLRVV